MHENNQDMFGEKIYIWEQKNNNDENLYTSY